MIEFEGMAIAAYWVWLGAGLILMFLELATGSLFLLWPAVAALVFAAVAYLAPGLPLAVQFAAFAVLTLALTWLGRSYFRISPANLSSDRPLLNQRGAQLAGRIVTALSGFENGQGEVRLDDSQWAARLADPSKAVAAGATLKVVSVDGATLVVEPA